MTPNLSRTTPSCRDGGSAHRRWRPFRGRVGSNRTPAAGRRRCGACWRTSEAGGEPGRVPLAGRRDTDRAISPVSHRVDYDPIATHAQACRRPRRLDIPFPHATAAALLANSRPSTKQTIFDRCQLRGTLVGWVRTDEASAVSPQVSGPGPEPLRPRRKKPADGRPGITVRNHRPDTAFPFPAARKPPIRRNEFAGGRNDSLHSVANTPSTV